MITCSASPVHTHATDNSWQAALADVVTDPAELLAQLALDQRLLPDALKANNEFTLKVPRAYVAKMAKGDPDDPLLRQVLPLGVELTKTTGYLLDPLAEKQQMPCNGLLHKYPGRVLLIVSGACAIHCRFCFRRHFPYTDHQLSGAHWQSALGYIAADPSIHEVILSGGDPLATTDQRLAKLTTALSAIAHVNTLRIHSRLPVVIPQRVTPAMVTWLTSSRLKPIMVIHCNHANEIDATVQQALSTLQQAGVLMLNQTVLLKGVNDSVSALRQLSECLVQASVLPYYLHLLDPVQGAAHFHVDTSTAVQLIRDMTDQCPGYWVPTLVREVPGRASKIRIHDGAHNRSFAKRQD